MKKGDRIVCLDVEFINLLSIGKIYYVIKKIDEVFDIGYEEYFYSNNYCFIEWPELISELLPDSYVYVSIVEDEKWIIKIYVN